MNFFAVLIPRVLYVSLLSRFDIFSLYICLSFVLVFFFFLMSWRHSSMAHWVILIIFLNAPHLPQSTGAKYDLLSIVVASVFNISAIWMRILLLLHVVQGSPCQSCLKRKLGPLCWGLHKSKNIGIGVFSILYRLKRLLKIKSLNEAAVGYFWTCEITTNAMQCSSLPRFKRWDDSLRG